MYTPSEQEAGKEGPNPHRCKVSSAYVPGFGSIVPGEDEDAFSNNQNTRLKWLSQPKSFPVLRRGDRICREGVRAIETFSSC